MLEGLSLIILELDTEQLPFDCDNTELNGFFFDDAKDYLKGLLAKTYILHDGTETVAYWNYLNDKISYNDLGSDEKWSERIVTTLTKRKKLKSYPAVKIGRLAVNSKYKGKGIGKMIIDYTKETFLDKNRTGCKFITVDAFVESLDFYEKQGFNFLSSKDRKSDTRLMFFNLASL
jgi:GNAT superfamily N-acetyltransferase